MIFPPFRVFGGSFPRLVNSQLQKMSTGRGKEDSFACSDRTFRFVSCGVCRCQREGEAQSILSRREILRFRFHSAILCGAFVSRWTRWPPGSPSLWLLCRQEFQCADFFVVPQRSCFG